MLLRGKLRYNPTRGIRTVPSSLEKWVINSTPTSLAGYLLSAGNSNQNDKDSPKNLHGNRPSRRMFFSIRLKG